MNSLAANLWTLVGYLKLSRHIFCEEIVKGARSTVARHKEGAVVMESHRKDLMAGTDVRDLDGELVGKVNRMYEAVMPAVVDGQPS